MWPFDTVWMASASFASIEGKADLSPRSSYETDASSTAMIHSNASSFPPAAESIFPRMWIFHDSKACTSGKSLILIVSGSLILGVTILSAMFLSLTCVESRLLEDRSRAFFAFFLFLRSRLRL